MAPRKTDGEVLGNRRIRRLVRLRPDLDAIAIDGYRLCPSFVRDGNVVPILNALDRTAIAAIAVMPDVDLAGGVGELAQQSVKNHDGKIAPVEQCGLHRRAPLLHPCRHRVRGVPHGHVRDRTVRPHAEKAGVRAELRHLPALRVVHHRHRIADGQVIPELPRILAGTRRIVELPMPHKRHFAEPHHAIARDVFDARPRVRDGKDSAGHGDHLPRADDILRKHPVAHRTEQEPPSLEVDRRAIVGGIRAKPQGCEGIRHVKEARPRHVDIGLPQVRHSFRADRAIRHDHLVVGEECLRRKIVHRQQCARPLFPDDMITFKERCDIELQHAALDIDRHIAQHGASAKPRITPPGIGRDRPDIVRAAGKQQPADENVVADRHRRPARQLAEIGDCFREGHCAVLPVCRVGPVAARRIDPYIRDHVRARAKRLRAHKRDSCNFSKHRAGSFYDKENE